MIFKKGNKAASANPNKKAVAEAIRVRIETEKDMPNAELGTLGRVYAKLTQKRRRRRKTMRTQKLTGFDWRAEPTAEEARALERRLEAEARQPTRFELLYLIRYSEAKKKAERIAARTETLHTSTTPEAESQPLEDNSFIDNLKQEMANRK